jgi:hypothetical protein
MIIPIIIILLSALIFFIAVIYTKKRNKNMAMQFTLLSEKFGSRIDYKYKKLGQMSLKLDRKFKNRRLIIEDTVGYKSGPASGHTGSHETQITLLLNDSLNFNFGIAIRTLNQFADVKDFKIVKFDNDFLDKKLYVRTTTVPVAEILIRDKAVKQALKDYISNFPKKYFTLKLLGKSINAKNIARLLSNNVREMVEQRIELFYVFAEKHDKLSEIIRKRLEEKKNSQKK